MYHDVNAYSRRPDGAGLAARQANTPQEKRFSMERIFAGNQGLTYGVIAPDPSPEITETPAFSPRTCGMNSCFAWTVFRVTMSFYGVAHDRLLFASSDGSRGGLRLAIRATVSTAFASAEADRQIGVWCITPGSA